MRPGLMLNLLTPRRVASGQASPLTYDGQITTTFDTTGKSNVVVKCWGKGGDAGSGIGGGGGSYGETAYAGTPGLLGLEITLSGSVTVTDSDLNTVVTALPGLDGGDGGLGGTKDLGDITSDGGDGGALGGGRAGTAASNGASNSPGGTGPGDGGDPAGGTGRPARITIIWS